MRYIVTVAALILSYGPTASHAQRVYEAGNDYVENIQRPSTVMHLGKALDLKIVGGDNFMMTTLVTWIGSADLLLRPTCG